MKKKLIKFLYGFVLCMAGVGWGGMRLAAVRRYTSSLIFPTFFQKQIIRMYVYVYFSSVHGSDVTLNINGFHSPIPNSIGKHNFSHLK